MLRFTANTIQHHQYGNNIVTITYLYADGLPMMNSAGYAIIVRTVDSDGRAVDDYYYDLDMQPVYSSGYYGLHREYDPARQNNSVTYLDENGQPVCSTSNYAGKRYDLDDSGVAIAEHYFDTHVLIYLCFKGEGFIPAGSNLTGIIRCQTPSTTIYILAP